MIKLSKEVEELIEEYRSKVKVGELRDIKLREGRMYKVVEIGDVLWNRRKVKPLVTLADEYGGKAAIVKDDHCLILLVGSGKKLKPATWWFREAIEAIPKEW